MKTILKELYNGKLNPIAKQLKEGSVSTKSMKTICNYEEELTSLLSGKEKELFEKLVSKQGEINYLNGEERFIEGFRLGARVMVEVFEKDDGELTDGKG